MSSSISLRRPTSPIRSALGLDPRCNLLGIAGRIKTLTTEDLAQAVRQTTHRGAEILAAVTCFRLFGTDSRRSLHLQLHARVVVASADDTDNRVFVLQAVRDTFQLRLGLALVAGRVGTATGGNRLGKHHRLQFRVVRACRTLALVEDRVLQVVRHFWPVMQGNEDVARPRHQHLESSFLKQVSHTHGNIEGEVLLVAVTGERALVVPAVPGIDHHGTDRLQPLNLFRAKLRLDILHEVEP